MTFDPMIVAWDMLGLIGDYCDKMKFGQSTTELHYQNKNETEWFFLNVISLMLIYSYSPSLSQISFKKSSGKVVFFFQNLATIEMRWDKNRLFCRHFETVQHFRIFWQNCDFLLPVHIWCKFHCKIPFGKWFSQGVPWTPLAPTGVKVPWSLKC